LPGAGVIWVFAQMHRSAILSRINDTNVNEPGWDFYLRLFTFGLCRFLPGLPINFPSSASVCSASFSHVSTS
jgi:hypothetical protein